jgi:hypothetical protein
MRGEAAIGELRALYSISRIDEFMPWRHSTDEVRISS